jgi:hypothetical protein
MKLSGSTLKKFKCRGDLTKMINGKLANCLDEVLLDEDIGGFFRNVSL